MNYYYIRRQFLVNVSRIPAKNAKFSNREDTKIRKSTTKGVRPNAVKLSDIALSSLRLPELRGAGFPAPFLAVALV
jgi:hypothetical protein